VRTILVLFRQCCEALEEAHMTLRGRKLDRRFSRTLISIPEIVRPTGGYGDGLASFGEFFDPVHDDPKPASLYRKGLARHRMNMRKRVATTRPTWREGDIEPVSVGTLFVICEHKGLAIEAIAKGDGRFNRCFRAVGCD
jgi:hypothetical protein